MCTSTRMIYILTYRALREFNAGRKSVNPIEAMHQMETSVPNSVCHHTHDVMMLANRSFNQRYEKPAIVHEVLTPHGLEWANAETSYMRLQTPATAHYRLNIWRNRAYAHKAAFKRSNLFMLSISERMARAEARANL